MVVTTCFAMPTTCFGMLTNEIKHTMHYSGLKGTPVQIQHVEEIFFAEKKLSKPCYQVGFCTELLSKGAIQIL